MMLWLPLAGGSAFAASVAMQAPSSHCHEADVGNMHHADTHHHQHENSSASSASAQDHECNACGVCHLACGGFLIATPDVPAAAVLPRENTPYLLTFDSITTVPLVPPPLARA